ncbi:hypothetical protein VTL71DRAFT_16492 [Oculimacula yallundae]|uniref:UspA domain-containing protein n=1 Tax=Oculimacula yallundae TaxID=86028 RepID=A0ABR4CEL6_9HELO
MSTSSEDVSPNQVPTKAESPPISPLALPISTPSDNNTNDYLNIAPARAPLDSIIEHVKADHIQLHNRSRVGSVSSISFKTTGLKHPTAANGEDKNNKAKRRSLVRDVSPPAPPRFQHHVSFDNFAGGEGTAKNSISFTLNVKHRGYQRKRRSRTFMVGVDENDYSDIALSWMLEELVDDGDEVICLRVVDKDAKVVNDRNVDKKSYQEEAKKLMERIVSRNDENRAISIVLEFAVGKVHAVFQKMIQLYEPAMLIVGTRGRSLGGFQGLMTISNSFSKWCLQYSPIPVVVVRPTEKRTKKKKKRDADPSRQDYARILKESGLEVHETENGSTPSNFEETNTAEVEAHAVAAALGLPAKFDPAMKPFMLDGRNLRRVESADGTSVSPDSRPSSPTMSRKNSKARRESRESCDNTSVSGDETSYDEEDDEGEFETVSGQEIIANGGTRPDLDRIVKWHDSTSNTANGSATADTSPDSEDYMYSDNDELWSQGTAGTLSNASKQKNLDGLFLILGL